MSQISQRISPKQLHVSIADDKQEAPSDSFHSPPLNPEIANDLSVNGGQSKSSQTGGGDSHETLPRSLFSIFKKQFSWIPSKLTFSHLKPVIRGSIVSWISLVIFVIPSVGQVLGQAGFLILITAFISPPIEPFAGVVEKEGLTLLLVVSSWAWGCLATKLANLARSEYHFGATIQEIYSGKFIEAGPCIIYIVCLFLWTAFLLFMRARFGPGPFMAATAMGCICADIILTTAPLFPYPDYTIGQTVVIPIAFHSALALLASAFILPETVNAQFVKRLNAVMTPLAKGVKGQNQLLRISPLSKDFDPQPFSDEITRAEAALTPLSASARLIKRDISYGRLSGSNLGELQLYGQKLAIRATGMAHFYNILDTRRAKFPETPLPSHIATPVETPIYTQPSTPNDGEHESQKDRSLWSNSMTSLQKKLHLHHHHRQSSSFGHLLREALEHSREHHPVGVFESQYYMNIEKRHYHPNEEDFEVNSLKLLAESVEDLLGAASASMDHVIAWLDKMNSDRLRLPRADGKDFDAAMEKHREVFCNLLTSMETFVKERRHVVLQPYLKVSDPLRRSRHLPPHRFLFRSFSYQYHLLRFCEAVRDMLQAIEDLDRTHVKRTLWPPVLPLRSIFTWSPWETNESTEENDEENPDIIPGVDIKSQDLGQAEPRNADALPPSNFAELLGTRVYAFMSGLSGGNAQFALKAGMKSDWNGYCLREMTKNLTGILAVLLSLPNYIRNSAAFSIENKSVWALFMAQLTLARYRGDTISGFVFRVVYTSLGLLFGIAFWYASSGRGHGNPYGVCAVGAVLFPLITFLRVCKPGPPTGMVIFSTTVVLIVGYSWQFYHGFGAITSPGFGATVAWRRFLLVIIGVTASAIASFLPPATTIRKYHRTALATTTSEIGHLYCAIVSYATTRSPEDLKNTIRNMVALRSKLRRLQAQTANVPYEFSIRGKWPTARYKKVLDLQLDLSYFLSHFMSVIDHLEPKWCRAFLQRTRFVDAEFLGDILAVITMISTALRTGSPLPQITPAPLLDRFWQENHGLTVLQQEAADEYGLPKTVTLETLRDEQYWYFSVGVSRAHSIISHLDRLMLATKELVGERFHVDGVRLLPIMPESLDGQVKLETSGPGKDPANGITENLP